MAGIRANRRNIVNQPVTAPSLGAGLCAENHRGETALHRAALGGSIDACRALIAAGANVREQNYSGMTPLHLGSTFPAVCHFLVEAGADVHAANRHGCTPLHSAAANDSPEVCRLLVTRGADLEAPCVQGNTPLHHAVMRNHFQTVAALLDLGADIHALNRAEKTPLSVASSVEMCALLVSRGANPSYVPTRPTSEYMTAFQLAVREGKMDILQYFIERCGQQIEQRTIRGRSLLQIAPRHAEAKDYLLSLKANKVPTDAIVRRPVRAPAKPRPQATWMSAL